MSRYGKDWKVAGRHDEELCELGPTPWEWRQTLELRGIAEDFDMLCCLEGVKCKSRHGAEKIWIGRCGACTRADGRRTGARSSASGRTRGWVTATMRPAVLFCF